MVASQDAPRVPGTLPAPALRLRPPRRDDESAFRAAHSALAAQGHIFGLGFDPGLPWDTYLQATKDHRAGVNLPERWVPSTFLVAEVAGEIVGRTSIRHRLNEFLHREGGHIGYVVLQQHRRRGYATEILRQSLIIARALGIDRVLVTCEDRNAASIAVIEKCGGRLENVVGAEHPGVFMRRYWID